RMLSEVARREQGEEGVDAQMQIGLGQDLLYLPGHAALARAGGPVDDDDFAPLHGAFSCWWGSARLEPGEAKGVSCLERGGRLRVSCHQAMRRFSPKCLTRRTKVWEVIPDSRAAFGIRFGPCQQPGQAWLALGSGRGKNGDLAVAQADREVAA